MLTDNHGRRFYYLRLSVTDQCNFRCSYCLPEGYRQTDFNPTLTAADMLTVVRAFARLGTRKVRLTGGEPTLFRELPWVIEQVAATPGIQKVAVTTNGYKLPKVIDDWHRAGLSQLNVSIDSLDAAEFASMTGHDCLPVILRGIDRGLALGIPTKVNAVLHHESSRERLGQFLEWLVDTPVTLRFIELMQTGENRDYFISNHLRGDDIEAYLLTNGWRLVPRALDDGPAREYCHPDYRGRIGLITPYATDFCQTCNRLRVSAQGRLHLCLFADQGIEMLDVIRGGDSEQLALHIQQLMAGKAASHQLHQGQVGQTRNLAMLGG